MEEQSKSLQKTSLYKRIIIENNFDYGLPGSHIIQLSLDIIYREIQELKEELNKSKKLKKPKNN